jgi:SAM-dependent methyltransferase
MQTGDGRADMEPTEENRRAWDELHRLRVEATTDRPGLPAPIRALLPDIGGKRVLHELCGTGETSADLAALGGLVTAIDVWEQPLAVARERYPQVLFVQADPHALPVNLRRRRFDLVLAGGLLPYVYDLELWAGEAAAALRQGGFLFLYDLHPALACVDAASLRWRDDYFGGAIVVGTRLGPVRTLRLWRLGEVVSTVVAAGFAVRRLDELPTLTHVRRHDPRIPGAFALVAEKG